MSNPLKLHTNGNEAISSPLVSTECFILFLNKYFASLEEITESNNSSFKISQNKPEPLASKTPLLFNLNVGA